MLGTILEAFAGALIRWLSGWLEGRKLAKETQRADTAEAHVQADEQIIQAQKSRSETDQAIDNAGVDAARERLRDGFNAP